MPSIPPEQEESTRKRTETERQQDQRTNQYGLDQYRTEGNVIGVDRTETQLLVTIGLGRGETLVVVLNCTRVCPTINVGDYVEADGEQGDDGRFLAEDVHVAGR